MLRVQVDIREDAGGTGGGPRMPSILLLSGGEGEAAPLRFRVSPNGLALEGPQGIESSTPMGEWHRGNGWQLRVIRSYETNELSLMDRPALVDREIEISTLRDDKSLTQARQPLSFAQNPKIVIGRDRAVVGIFVDDDYVSRTHLEFYQAGDAVMVRDLNSTHGTKLNGRPIKEPVALRHGDELRLGRTMVRCLFYQDELLRALSAGELPSSPGTEEADAPKPAGDGTAAAKPKKPAELPKEPPKPPEKPPEKPPTPPKPPTPASEDEEALSRPRSAVRDLLIAIPLVLAILAALAYVILMWLRAR